MPNVDAEATVMAAPNHLSADLDREAVVLGLDAGIYYGMDQVGTRIWALLQEPVAVKDICAQICAEYDVQPDRCQGDVIAFLRDLLKEGLIQLCA